MYNYYDGTCINFVYVHHNNMQKDDKHISWTHLVKLYERNQSASGLTFLKKLKREHVFLNSYSRMRVNLAAQVNFKSFINNYL